MGSIGVGLLMGGVSFFIIHKNRALLGQSVPSSTPEVVDLLLSDPLVMSVQDVKASRISPGVSRFKAEIQFNPIVVANRYIDSEPGKWSWSILLRLSTTFCHSQCLALVCCPTTTTTTTTPPPTSSGNLEGIKQSFAAALSVPGDTERGAETEAIRLIADTDPDAALRQSLHRYSRMLMITLAFEVDRLEVEIRKAYPEFRYIDIEIL